MAIAASDLISPQGPIEKELFPGEDEKALIARLNDFISQGVAKAAGFTWPDVPATDAGVTAYALFLAFRQAHTLSLTRPAEEDLQAEMLGSTRFTDEQRQGIKDLADWYWTEWERLSEATLTDPSSAVSTGIPSHQSTNKYDW